MDGTIRLCYVSGFGAKLSHKFQNVMIFTRKPIFEGVFTSMLNDLTEIMFIPGYNYTLSSSKNIGVQSPDGSFNGCNGRLQRNVSDAGIYLYYYPSFEESFEVNQVLSERTLDIFSAYNKTSVGGHMSVMDSFSSLSSQVWLTFFAFCLVMGYLIKKFSPGFRSKKVLDVVAYHIFRQSSYPFRRGHRWFPRSLSVLMSIMTLFVGLYYVCLIKTDIVIVEQPKLINNYDDIISRLDHVIPQFMGHIDEPYDFKHGKKESKERIIWEAIQDRNFHISMIFEDRISSLFRGKTIEILDSETARMMTAFYCTMKNFMKTILRSYPWVSTDPSSRKIQYGFIMRKGVNPGYKKKLKKKGDKMVEGGLYDYDVKKILDGTQEWNSRAKHRSDYRKCISGKRQMEDIPYHSLTTDNFDQLGYWFLFFIYVAWMVLGIERLVAGYSRRIRFEIIKLINMLTSRTLRDRFL